MSDIDIRMVDLAPGVEVREKENGKTVIRGTAALYNSESRDLGGFVEVIEPGAFRRAMNDPKLDVFAKLDHDRVLARSKSGTLELNLTERGLEYVIHPKRADADVVEALERGDITGSSFAFRIAPGGDSWERRSADGVMIRTITDIEYLGDVSVVHTPAYPEADSFLSARCLEKAKEEERGRVIHPEPKPEPVVDEPAPEPVVDEPAPEPVVDEPAPEPVVEEPATWPVDEDPAPEEPVVDTVQEDAERSLKVLKAMLAIRSLKN
jgi:hypothetical protein